MRTLLTIVVILVIVVGGLKLAGVPIPFLDYRVGLFGEGQGPSRPEIVIEAPGFGDSDQLP